MNLADIKTAAKTTKYEETIARLTRERDAARAECRVWRKHGWLHDQYGNEDVCAVRLAHDAACPGWEKEK